jgi:RecJ-like exonuclease
MKNNKILIGVVAAVVIIGICFFVIQKMNENTAIFTSPAPTSTQNQQHGPISGKIKSITQNPKEIVVVGNGNDYTVMFTSSTAITRDVGGTMNGSFNFSNLQVGDSVSVMGNVNSDDTVISTAVEQTNAIIGQIASIYSNPKKIIITAPYGNTYTLLIVSSTMIIRDVAGGASGTLSFSSLQVGDLIGVIGQVNSDNTIYPSVISKEIQNGVN